MVKIVKAPSRKTLGQAIQDKQKKRYAALFISLVVIAAVIAIFNFSNINIAGQGKNANTAGTADGDSRITGQAIIGEDQTKKTDSAQVAKSNPPAADTTLKPKADIIPRFINYYTFLQSGLVSADMVDINKDNYPDLIIGSSNLKTKLYLNNRKDGFGEAYQFDMVKSSGIASADYDNDGNIDAALGITHDKDYIFYNDKSNNFPNNLRMQLPNNPTQDNTITSMVAFDFNNDGLADIAASRDDNQGNFLYINQDGKKFVNSPQFGNKRAQQIAVADFNNDGWQDVLVANYNDDSKIYLNRGTKKAKLFDEKNLTGRSGNFIRSVAVCDLNNDGWQDIVSANYEQENMVYLNKKGNGFESSAFTNDRKHSVAIACADFNKDGWNDMIVINYNEESYLYLNNKTKFVKNPLGIPIDTNIVKTADFNHDGYTDLFLGSYQGTSQVWLNSLGKI